MWLPAPIYELLPYGCSVAGGITLLHGDSPVLFTSGVLLLAAGLMAWKLRRVSRAHAVKKVRYGVGSRRTGRTRPTGARRRY